MRAQRLKSAWPEYAALGVIPIGLQQHRRDRTSLVVKRLGAPAVDESGAATRPCNVHHLHDAARPRRQCSQSRRRPETELVRRGVGYAGAPRQDGVGQLHVLGERTLPYSTPVSALPGGRAGAPRQDGVGVSGKPTLPNPTQPKGCAGAPRQDGVGELHVLGEGARGVVAPADRVGGRHHAAARLQRRHDAGLGDGDALLLHRLRARARRRCSPAARLLAAACCPAGRHMRASGHAAQAIAPVMHEPDACRVRCT